MMNQPILITAAWAALAAGVFTAFAEWLHHRRLLKLGRLAFGPDARPRAWTAAAPVLRVAALAGVVWALVVLLGFDGSSRMRERNAATTRHLIVLLDVSPSMDLQDAGDGGKQTRRDRAAALLKSVMERANSDEVKITMACFYSDAMLLVKECADREVIWNFADNLPLHIAYRPGKTSLLKSLNTAAGYAKDLPRKSATLLVLTDGDAVPDTGLQPLPSAVSDVLFVGVGSVARGTFLDGHLSRQDSASLSQAARRLGGHYHDGNQKNVPSELLRHLTASDQRTDHFQVSLRTLAIITLAVCTGVICLMPILLETFGSAWRPMAIPVSAKVEPAGRVSGVIA
jgi:Ca-activated chloride channel family protein